MEGTKETKDVVKFLCALISTVAEALKDGKVSLAEATSLVPVLMKLPAAIEGIDEIPDEAADFTIEEIEEIKELIVEDLDLPDDQVEAAVEHLLEMSVKLYALVKMKS